MQMKKICAITFLPLFAFTCVSKKNFIRVENKIDKNVYCIPSYAYPDTTLSFTNKEKIFANDTAYFLKSTGSKKLFYMV